MSKTLYADRAYITIGGVKIAVVEPESYFKARDDRPTCHFTKMEYDGGYEYDEWGWVCKHCGHTEVGSKGNGYEK